MVEQCRTLLRTESRPQILAFETDKKRPSILSNTGIFLSHPEGTVAQQQKWVESTHAEGERMKKLIDEMLFLAKQDARIAPPVKMRVDFSDMLWAVCFR